MPTTTPNLKTLNLKRSYPVSRERLFAAWTEPEQVIQWFGCKQTQCASAKIDKVVGGDYHIHFASNTCNSSAMCGTIRVYEPPAKLAFTFESSGNEEAEKMPATLATIHFREIEGGTELEIVHSEIPCQEMGESFKGGWIESLEKLAQQVA